MARILAEELQNENEYRMLKSLRYDEILSFVFDNIRQKTFSSRFYLVINFFYLFLLIGLSIAGFIYQEYRLSSYILYISGGILAGSFLVIPIHEALHGLAYKMIGAPRIHYGADLRQMLFFVAADRYVIGRKGFYLVALTPFIVINSLSILALFFLHPYWLVAGLAFLLLHNIMCIGDFSMVSYFELNPGRELYTYDDHKIRTSYIFEKIIPA